MQLPLSRFELFFDKQVIKVCDMKFANIAIANKLRLSITIPAYNFIIVRHLAKLRDKP